MNSPTPQEMGSQTLESIVVSRTNTQAQQDKKPKAAAPDMQALKCPRCDSTNTKFCYYNNYSLSQPRYFCKSCRRYWTKGGTLRNVPVGGGCRKNKRSSSSSSYKRTQDDQPFAPLPSPIPSFSYDSSDLSLAIARLQKQPPSRIDDFSSWGNSQLHGGIIGNSGGDDNSGWFAEAPTCQNLYYGNGSGELGMGFPFEDFGGGGTTAVKQESRVLWGWPWQNAAAEFDSGRVNWNVNENGLLI